MAFIPAVIGGIGAIAGGAGAAGAALLPYAGSIASVGSGVMGILSARAETKAAKDAAKYNTIAAINEAKVGEQLNLLSQRRSRKAANEKLDMAVNQMIASGGGVDLNVLSKLAYDMAEDISIDSQLSAYQIQAKYNEAAMASYQGKLAGRTGKLKTFASSVGLIGPAAKLAGPAVKGLSSLLSKFNTSKVTELPSMATQADLGIYRA